MPEMPEVETYIRELEPSLRGRAITGAIVHWPRIIATPSPDEFSTNIVGQRFTTFGRRGKYMLFGLERNDGHAVDTLIVHLRMTGKLQPISNKIVSSKHTHVVLNLDDGQQLHYIDPRKFGRLWLTPDPDMVLHKLGPEPLGDKFSVVEFAQTLEGRKASIKSLLLNQSIVAGVGNIYADEALFSAGIRPDRPGGELDSGEITQLYDSVIAVLADAIKWRGSSLGGSNLQNYARPGGEPGDFQERHNVFQRTGKPCPICGTPIERIVLAQRSTHFCRHCQS